LDRRFAEFASLAEALDYAALGGTGLNFYSARGELIAAVPYAALRADAIAIARGLVQAGLARGARMVVLAETNRDFVTLFLACQYAGVVPVPVAIPTTIGSRDAYIAGLRRQFVNCGAMAAMGPDELVPHLAAAADGLDMSLIGGPAAFRDLPGGHADLRPLGADEPCYLQFSSGSTRHPQAIEIRQRSPIANCRAIALHGLSVVPDDRCISWLPLYHDMGLVGFFLTPLLIQMSVDYLATRDFARRPSQWLSIMTRNGGTLSYSPSFGYELCVRRAADMAMTALDLRRWRVAGLGGDMIQPHVLRQFADAFAPAGFSSAAFVPSYGLAEATLAVSFGALGEGLRVDRVGRRPLADAGLAEPADDDRGGREFVVCGRPLPGHQVMVRDPYGRAVPDRRVGRIFVKGPSVMAGYFRQPEATAETLSPDGWLDTGDLGYTIAGAVVITGRDKDLIIVNGRNIWPQDIEWAVEELPGLRRGDIAALSVVGDEGDEQVIVLAQCRLTDGEARAALIGAIEGVVRQVAAIECVAVLVPPHSLPKTSSGKLSRSAARRLYLAGRFATEAAPTPVAAEASATSGR